TSIQGLPEFLHQGPVDAVVRIGAVDRDRADRWLYAQLDGRVGHEQRSTMLVLIPPNPKALLMATWIGWRTAVPPQNRAASWIGVSRLRFGWMNPRLIWTTVAMISTTPAEFRQ